MNTTAKQTSDIRSLTNEEVDAVAGARIVNFCVQENRWDTWMLEYFNVCRESWINV